MNTGDSLSAYLARIGYAGAVRRPSPSFATYTPYIPPRSPSRAWIPFSAAPSTSTPAAIHAKLVHGRRGGYCHEHNAPVPRHAGRTRLCGTSAWRPGGPDVGRTGCPVSHRITLVDLPEGRFIADVGFGGQTPTAPLRLEPGLEQVTSHGTYRLVHEGAVFEMQMLLSDRWAPMYRFVLEPQSPADFEMANWFTSTHPRGRFTQNLIAARVIGQTRVTLLNTSLAVRHADGARNNARLPTRMTFRMC